MRNLIITVKENVVNARGGRLFVISDLHGNLNAFNHWLEAVRFNGKDFCIVNGDVIDRGSHGIAMLLYFMQNMANFLFLMGNHEEFLLGAIREVQKGIYNGISMRNLFANGGEPTWNDFCSLEGGQQRELISFLENAPYLAVVKDGIHELPTYVCHAGINRNWYQNLQRGVLAKDENGYHHLTWARENYRYVDSDMEGLVITGHSATHTIGGIKGEPLFDCDNQRIFIDCATIKTNKVGYVVIYPTGLTMDSV